MFPNYLGYPMPRRPSYPVFIDELHNISANKLPIKPLQVVTGRITHPMLNTNFEILATETRGKFIFNYQGKQVEIILTSMPSNLGKGVIWYFICPESGKRCRKLRFYKGKILHHSSIPANYSKQNYSKNMRALDNVARAEFSDPAEELLKPYCKPYYNGKPTKVLERVQRRINRFENGKKKYLDRFWKYMR